MGTTIIHICVLLEEIVPKKCLQVLYANVTSNRFLHNAYAFIQRIKLIKKLMKVESYVSPHFTVALVNHFSSLICFTRCCIILGRSSFLMCYIYTCICTYIKQ